MSTITRPRGNPACRGSRAVARVVEVAELVHESFGVPRPTLAVAADPGQQPLPSVEQVGSVDDLRALEVVSGHALVDHRGRLAPGRIELVVPVNENHMVPGREKSSEGGVYQAPPSLIGATLQAMVRIGSAMSKCTPLKPARMASAFSCIHASNASRLPQSRAGSRSSAFTASSTEPRGRCAARSAPCRPRSA